MDHGKIVQYGTPMEVYDKPKTTFVASFIGNSNLFNGILKRDAEDQLIFEAEGLRLPFPSNYSDQVGNTINLLLRPEHLMLKPLEEKSPEENLGVKGTITFLTLLGLSTEYEVKLDSGSQLKLETTRNRDQSPLPEGTRVWVYPIDADSYLTIPV
jgi:ABC-type Fe3+/spermidine/putrescine transport system ATPase subunit